MRGQRKNSNRGGQSRLNFQSSKVVEAPANGPIKRTLSTKTTVDEDQQAKLLAQQTEALEEDPRYARLLKKLSGDARGFHQEELSVLDKLLRQFDLNTSYGPCAGVSRLDRWNRAKRLGQEPPEEVRDILVSPIGGLDQYKHSYLGAYP